jgi:hypothetical protein
MTTLATITTKVEAKLETGSYSGKLVEIKETKEGKFGKYWPFIFEIDKMQDDGEWADLDEEVELMDQVTAEGRFGPGSKLFKIGSAAKGRELEEDESIDTEDLINKRYILTIEKTKKGENTYSNIKSYAPWKRSKTGPGSGPAQDAPNSSSRPTSRKAPDLD